MSGLDGVEVQVPFAVTLKGETEILVVVHELDGVRVEGDGVMRNGMCECTAFLAGDEVRSVSVAVGISGHRWASFRSHRRGRGVFS